ncbi:putative transglutaminase-like cysteine proteinase [Rhizobium leguminosarum]|uniref:Transglutaminase-like cysteine proteinase n=1 Tax=Rhizobium leguminosarum TaxID=384 RepID=A0AAE2MRT1_RHILE|nr:MULTISPECIES: transglutaminase-like cysteine peptidase [Rhizobium]MBB4294159.1 putative transglutaminase-like cysteine proteinase [Rhizobium leguminosarum]MBB4300655.1 putative transglutaminase-like cysteine proteinase [Rhizobium leguminosarum]MBB4312033.1 putative transglutaminase-like cysteine proteinase [Rhizobium leguminosarum]MBB4420997.1 putative transglutaminase-like cysteine proteinase [Rhizobium leguminosarum]MBB4436185.1 putative transglutaminase-like cysteine proteinase [Rhizobiu
MAKFRKITIGTKAAFVAATAVVAATSPLNATGLSALTRDSGNSLVRIGEGPKTLAPFASVVFCMQHKDQCVNTGGPLIMVLDKNRKSQLISVNTSVNHTIRPLNDKPGADVWSVDVTAGDCEDFALTKRKKLMQLGWSSQSLKIAVAITNNGEGHAVLIAKTSEGDLVLDNRFNAIKDWRKTDLRWVMAQIGDNPKYWAKVKANVEEPQLVSAREAVSETAEIGHSNAGGERHPNITVTFAYFQ